MIKKMVVGFGGEKSSNEFIVTFKDISSAVESRCRVLMPSRNWLPRNINELFNETVTVGVL